MISELLVMIQAVAVPTGQAAVSAPSVASECQAVDLRTGKTGTVSDAVDLYITCGPGAVRLGRAESYESSYNVAMRSVVVVFRDLGKTRVVLAFAESDGTPHLEDVTRDLAKQSGRSVDAGLGVVPIDMSRFATEGSLSLASVQPLQLASNGSLARGGVSSGQAPVDVKLDLLSYVAAERSFMAAQSRLSPSTVEGGQ